MPQITDADIRRLAMLTRLDLSQDERTRFARQLQEMLEFAAQVQSVATSSDPLPADAAPSTLLREDETRPSLSRREVLDAAPEADEATGLFKVPRVLG